MDKAFIVSYYAEEGGLVSRLLPFQQLSDCLFHVCHNRSLPVSVHSYELGSMTREDFLSWDVHNLDVFDINFFEFEFNVSLFF